MAIKPLKNLVKLLILLVINAMWGLNFQNGGISVIFFLKCSTFKSKIGMYKFRSDNSLVKPLKKLIKLIILLLTFIMWGLNFQNGGRAIIFLLKHSPFKSKIGM